MVTFSTIFCRKRKKREEERGRTKLNRNNQEERERGKRKRKEEEERGRGKRKEGSKSGVHPSRDYSSSREKGDVHLTCFCRTLSAFEANPAVERNALAGLHDGRPHLHLLQKSIRNIAAPFYFVVIPWIQGSHDKKRRLCFAAMARSSGHRGSPTIRTQQAGRQVVKSLGDVETLVNLLRDWLDLGAQLLLNGVQPLTVVRGDKVDSQTEVAEAT